MFNIFKRKYKRSEWLSGLLNAEEIVKKHSEVPYWLIKKDFQIGDYSQGENDYIVYFENILKNL